MEKRISFTSGELTLEGRYSRSSGAAGAIVTHPHPLYGGDMANPVVESLVHAYRRKNISTLRFNFRGVGLSQGEYDQGIGERQDVLAAIDFLLEQGLSTIELAGYSFGAWVNAHLEHLPVEVATMIFVSPPLALLSFTEVGALSRLRLVVCGEEDEIAPPSLVEKTLPGWNTPARLAIIDYADHFYNGCFPALERVMDAYLSGQS
ncbi:MAG: alpha/beta hydrolase [Desulfopila sp.]